MELEGRSAIVTGGAGGLGAATVRQLVELGMGVAVFDRDDDRAGALAKELGDAAIAVVGDVNDDGDVGAAIDAARSIGALSLVVNVAGGGVGGGRTVGRDGTPHDKASFEQHHGDERVRHVQRQPARRGGDGRQRARRQRPARCDREHRCRSRASRARPASSPTRAAKAAILGMTLPMARDLAPIGVRVCAIAPGTMGTPLMLSIPEADQGQARARASCSRSAWARPEEFALLVESIARNPYLNGENIRLDGAARGSLPSRVVQARRAV